MLTFTLSISCLTTSNLPWFMDLTFWFPVQYCSLQHRTLLVSPVPSTTGYCFCFGSIPSFFLELLPHWSPVAYWAPTDLGSFSFSILSFCLLILFTGFSRQEYWSGLPFPSPVHHILSDLSIMTQLSWSVMDHAEAWPWGATSRPRSGVATESARLRQRRSGGREELPYAWGQGRWSRRATISPRSGAEAQRNYPTPEFRGPTRVELPHLQGAAAGGPRGDTPCSRSGGAAEKMPFVQHKEHWLRFAGATVKRYPTSKVRETQVRQWVLREGIRGQTH